MFPNKIFLIYFKLFSRHLYVFFFMLFLSFDGLVVRTIANPTTNLRQFRYCDLVQAEACFQKLFYEMPFCSPTADSADLSIRCQHFNVLDICFREHSIMCPPTAIGQAARSAFRQRVSECKYSHYEDLEQPKIRKHKTSNEPNNSFDLSLLRLGPSELQIISLFGYLQTQCRRRRAPSPQSRRNSNGSPSTAAVSPTFLNCSLSEYNEILFACEGEIKSKQLKRQNSALDRHQLIRAKLDASSRLLQFSETRSDDECLMVRSELSDIFLIHQKYCFQSTLTRCMCEQLNFERTCDIRCSNLEAFGLPLNQQLYWKDFRGRLSGSNGHSAYSSYALSIGHLIVLSLLIWFRTRTSDILLLV